MAITKCIRGHYYDDAKYMACPHCKAGEDMEEDTHTIAIRPGEIENQAILYLQGFGRKGKINVDIDDEKTIGMFSGSRGNDFVTGWLVCVEGPEKGRDYRLHYGFNKVGRSRMMDVCILEDGQIARETHCSIVYENRQNRFYAAPKGGNLVYLNDELLDESKDLKSGDILEMGESRFEFVAFCKGERKWTEEEKN